MRLCLCISIASLLLAGAVQAQAPKTANTVSLSDSTAGLDVSLEALDFLVGTWAGEGLGGEVDELWTAEAGGQMHGLFRLVSGGEVSLSEHMVLDRLDGRPTLRVKHFSNNFEGWEAPSESVDFPLVRVEDGAAFFDGLTIRQDGPNRLIYHLAMRTADGFQEAVLNYVRKQ
ncbi:MAG: hypothetical protein HKN29_03285 [Rhodothermales bacterium]|nr:hypothetical protein [Rhodothermales bacterium]